MEIVCTKCGAIDDYKTEFRSGQQCAFCNSCGAFIKNIAYSEPKFYFGKYKNVLIRDVNDIGYLQWFLDNVEKISVNGRKTIKEQIEFLKNPKTKRTQL